MQILSAINRITLYHETSIIAIYNIHPIRDHASISFVCRHSKSTNGRASSSSSASLDLRGLMTAKQHRDPSIHAIPTVTTPIAARSAQYTHHDCVNGSGGSKLTRCRKGNCDCNTAELEWESLRDGSFPSHFSSKRESCWSGPFLRCIILSWSDVRYSETG